MELLQIQQTTEKVQKDANESSSDQFIIANTQPMDFVTMKDKCIIPSFAKDNESTISHTDFIYAVKLAAENWFKKETILRPAIRVSHPIKGRIPEAMGKPIGLDLAQGRGVMAAQNDSAISPGSNDGAAAVATAATATAETDPIQQLMANLRGSGAVEVARLQAREMAQRARNAVKQIPPSPMRDELVNLIDLVMERDN